MIKTEKLINTNHFKRQKKPSSFSKVLERREYLTQIPDILVVLTQQVFKFPVKLSRPYNK